MTRFGWSAAALVAAGCSSPGSAAPRYSQDCPGQTVCVAAHGQQVPGAAPELGNGDGSAGSVTFTVVRKGGDGRVLTDLEFHPTRTNELWTVDHEGNAVLIGEGVGTPAARWTVIDNEDPHFLGRPSALAMGSPDPKYGSTWGGCNDHDDDGSNKEGPVLWSGELSILGHPTPGGLGSHLDMLHSSPFCRGIAHEQANVYWVFNSFDKSLDRYDFHQPHEPGGDDHSDGEIWRYATGQVLGVTGTPSHVAWDAMSRRLFVADTGHSRIVRLDPSTARPGKPLPRPNEPVKTRLAMDGATVDEIVAPGVVDRPSGIEVRNGLVYVSDAATSRFYAFDATGKMVRSLDTSLPAGSLAGFNFGPDGKLYFVDMVGSSVLRVDPK